jgi:mRNA interferase MazF
MPKLPRGDVWLVDLSPTRGHEQRGKRPVLIVSEDDFNQGPAGLVIVLPITSTQRPIPTQVHLSPPEGGLKNPSAILCDAIRSISTERLVRYWGRVSGEVMDQVDDRLRILLSL